jgi:hypothetical protein
MIQGLGFRVQESGLKVQGVGYRMKDLGFEAMFIRI